VRNELSTGTHCNTLQQHTVTYCNTLNTLLHTNRHATSSSLAHTATHCNITLHQHTATPLTRCYTLAGTQRAHHWERFCGVYGRNGPQVCWRVWCVSWLIHIWHDLSICDFTHSYVTWLILMWHDSFICDMTHSYVMWLIRSWHDSFTHSYEAWLVYTWYDSRKVMSHMNESCHIWMSHVPYEWVMSHVNESCPIWMSHVPYEW